MSEKPIYELRPAGAEIIRCGTVSVQLQSRAADIEGFINTFQNELAEDLKQKLEYWLFIAKKRERGIPKKPKQELLRYRTPGNRMPRSRN